MISKETKDALAKKHGAENLRILELPKDDDGKEVLEVVACVPDRSTIAQFQKYQEVNPKKAQDILINQCILTDTETVIGNTGLSLTAISLLADLIPIREGKIKKF